MVTLQILVLPFLVRVRVAQQRTKKAALVKRLFSFINILNYSSFSVFRISASTAFIFSTSRFSSSFSLSTFF